MHLCDNPRCINPAHLKVGSQSENLLGVQERFTEDEKRVLRFVKALTGCSYRALARTLGGCHKTMRKACVSRRPKRVVRR